MSSQEYTQPTNLITVEGYLAHMSQLVFFRFTHCSYSYFLQVGFPAPPPHPHHTVLFGRKLLCTPYNYRMRLFFTSLRVMFLHKLFEILHGRFVSSSPFNCSVIYLHHCDHIFCVLIQYYSTFCSNCSGFGHWDLFQLVPVILWQTPIIYLCVCVCVCVFVFFSICILFGTIRSFKFILCIPCFIPRISHFFKEHWFFAMATDTRNQDLRGRCDLLLLICSGPLNW